MFITAVCVSVLIKLPWPRNKSIFCVVCGGTSKRQWSSDFKVNVVKYNFGYVWIGYCFDQHGLHFFQWAIRVDTI